MTKNYTHVWDLKIPANGQLIIRKTDNVLDLECNTIVKIVMKDGVCIQAETIQEGCYGNDLLGMTQEELQDMIDYDPTGQHPEQWSEIVVEDNN